VTHEEQVGEESGDEECDTQDLESLKIETHNESIDSLENVVCFFRKSGSCQRVFFAWQFSGSSYCFKNSQD
jgi:hypothetical protein